MFEKIITGPYGGYIVMGVLMAAIALLLRLLYGPRGFFRDPQWDESNKRIRAEEAACSKAREERWELDQIYPKARKIELDADERLDFDEHCSLFRHFAQDFFSFRPEDAPLRLKEVHSLRVYDHAKRIAASENFSDSVARAGVLAALYHDCGRFPQFRRYHTFADAVSVDHGDLSCETLKKRHFLMGESEEVQQLVEKAVQLHNKKSLPDDLTPEERTVTDIVRDADKLDIIAIMVSRFSQALPEKDAVLLHVKDEPEAFSPEIVADVLAARGVAYTKLRYVNDFRMLLGLWVKELRFDVTRQALRESGNMDKILSGLPDVPELKEVKSYLYALLESSFKGDTGAAS